MRYIRMLIMAILFLLIPSVPAAHASSADLPAAAALEMKHLEETYRVLDIVATKIWPGWTNYRQVPFLFNFENGLRVLIGHPNPPAGFQTAPDMRCADRPVAIDRTKAVALELKSPLRAGGGPMSFGQTADGKDVTVVDMSFTRPDRRKYDSEADQEPATTESQILVYLHELFHCFQQEHVRIQLSGNFRFNPDLTYAVYSELEGLALQRAYLEPDADKARALLKDFLVARHLKRSGSMTEQQGNQESSDEFREGGATYAEVRTLEVLKAEGFKPGLTEKEDPEYRGFGSADGMLQYYSKRLEKDAAQSADNYSKSYTYGCFQALLCQRLFPGWQESLVAGTRFLDVEIGKRLPVSPEERASIERRFSEAYPIGQIRERHATFLNARDSAYRQVKARAGRVYVLDFKRTGQYIRSLAKTKDSYGIGLTQVQPDGLPGFNFDDVELSRVTAPAELDQLYYIRVVDTEWKERSEAFKLSGDKQPDGTWKNAQVRTPLFTLTAPHVRVRETGNRVKIQILSRVK